MKIAATPWLYRSIGLDFGSSCAHLQYSDRNIELYPRLVREVAVQGLDPTMDRTSVERLIEIIPTMPNLERFQLVATPNLPSVLLSSV